MDQATPSMSIALARFSGRFKRQKGDVLRFDENGIQVLAGGEAIQVFPYAKISRIDYFHFPKNLPQMIRMMSGALFNRQEAIMKITCEDKLYEYTFEQDLEFRSGELVGLFKVLYKKGIRLKEFTSAGTSAFLLKAMPQSEVNARVDALRTEA